MAIPRIVPPLDYLRQASPTSLQSFELSRLNHAANLRREIGALLDQWIQETSEALLARWLLDHHNSLQESRIPPSELFQSFIEPEPNSLPASANIVPAPPRFADLRQPLSGHAERKSQRNRSTA